MVLSRGRVDAVDGAGQFLRRLRLRFCRQIGAGKQTQKKTDAMKGERVGDGGKLQKKLLLNNFVRSDNK